MYIDVPLYGALLMRLGSFPARAHATHPYGVQYASEVLAAGNTVLIFPEDRRTLAGESPPHRGVEYLAALPAAFSPPIGGDGGLVEVVDAAGTGQFAHVVGDPPQDGHHPGQVGPRPRDSGEASPPLAAG
jgi:hypothetical protein